VVLSIFAVIAVNLFRNNESALLGTFDSFTAAFFALLGIVTGEQWSDLVRQVDDRGAASIDPSAAAFFLTFVVFVSIMSFNIIVAVRRLGLRAEG